MNRVNDLSVVLIQMVFGILIVFLFDFCALFDFLILVIFLYVKFEFRADDDVLVTVANWRDVLSSHDGYI